jgi:hypothetical protein
LPEEMSASLVRAIMEDINGVEALVPEMILKVEFQTIWK